jgi:hypothetical protein
MNMNGSPQIVRAESRVQPLAYRTQGLHDTAKHYYQNVEIGFNNDLDALGSDEHQLSGKVSLQLEI